MIGSWYRRRYCRARMTGYVRGELPPAVRRRIGHYIDTDPACYAEYALCRETERQIAASLSVAPPVAGLDRIWQAIQDDLATPKTMRLPARARYGIVGALIALLIALPFASGQGYTYADSPERLLQPVPQVRQATTIAYEVNHAQGRTQATIAPPDDNAPGTEALLINVTPTPAH